MRFPLDLVFMSVLNKSVVIFLEPEHQTEGMDGYKGKVLCIPDLRISSA